VSDKKACTVTWPQDSQGIGLTAKLTWNTADNDQQILASQVFLAKGSTDDKQLSLAPGDTQLPVSIELPASLDNAINHDVCFNGTLGLQAGKAQINGDVTKTDSGQSIAVTFCLQKPPSPLPFIIGGLLLLVILVVLLWPRWPKDLKLLVDGQVYVGDVLELDHYGPFGAIRLGQGDVSVVLLSPQKKPGTYAEMLPSVKTSWLGQRLGGTDTATYHLVPKEGYELKETGATKSSKDPIDITAGQHIALVGKERTWQLMLRQDMPKKQGN
jgi:hypothetical protein